MPAPTAHYAREPVGADADAIRMAPSLWSYSMADATGFHVHPNPKEHKVELLLLESIDHVSRLVLEPKDVSVIAGQLLGAAAQVFEKSGKPPPYRTNEDKITATGIRCSGWNIGPGS